METMSPFRLVHASSSSNTLPPSSAVTVPGLQVSQHPSSLSVEMTSDHQPERPYRKEVDAVFETHFHSFQVMSEEEKDAILAIRGLLITNRRGKEINTGSSAPSGQMSLSPKPRTTNQDSTRAYAKFSYNEASPWTHLAWPGSFKWRSL